MPTCNLCTKHFPNIFVVEGKERNLSQRKYCLDCSPFGVHNTEVLDSPYVYIEKVVCSICQKTYIYNRKKGHRKETCVSCIQKARRERQKKKAYEYKGSKCYVCSYNKCLEALHFHHTNPKDKKFSIARSYNSSWTKIKEELDKCILVCATCHAEIHSKLL